MSSTSSSNGAATAVLTQGKRQRHQCRRRRGAVVGGASRASSPGGGSTIIAMFYSSVVHSRPRAEQPSVNYLLPTANWFNRGADAHAYAWRGVCPARGDAAAGTALRPGR